MSDWKELGGCVNGNVADKTWIRKPLTLAGEAALRQVCLRCDVFDECKADADEFQVSGVFQAGAWRD